MQVPVGTQLQTGQICVPFQDGGAHLVEVRVAVVHLGYRRLATA
jgi:hypothetical protein